jgi:hypothetical protein
VLRPIVLLTLYCSNYSAEVLLEIGAYTPKTRLLIELTYNSRKQAGCDIFNTSIISVE